MFKVVLTWSDGSREEDDELFDTEAEANEWGGELVGNYRTGVEVLHLSNPFENPEPDAGDEPDWAVVEVEG